MTKQTIEQATRAKAARETVLDYFGYVRDMRMMIDYPLLGAALNGMGMDALSDHALLKLASTLNRAKAKALREMPQSERRELELVSGAMA